MLASGLASTLFFFSLYRLKILAWIPLLKIFFFFLCLLAKLCSVEWVFWSHYSGLFLCLPSILPFAALGVVGSGLFSTHVLLTCLHTLRLSSLILRTLSDLYCEKPVLPVHLLFLRLLFLTLKNSVNLLWDPPNPFFPLIL